MPRTKFTLLFIVLCLGTAAFSQTRTQSDVLRSAGLQQAEKERINFERVQRLAKQKNWPVSVLTKNGGISILTGTDLFGNPVYLTTDNNIRAAATIGTNQLWQGGSTGLNLNGSSANVKGKLGLWDGGKVLATHIELTGRITNKDNTANSDHSTHVAGTLMASGVNPLAKGMAYGLQELIVRDFNNHLSEMFLESANEQMLISNHSYGEKAGWIFNDANNHWEFWGAPGSSEDYKFGYYSADTQIWDSIAYNAPYYLIVKSSGNARDVNGPDVGQPYDRFNSSNNMAPAGNRPNGISNNDGYDIISTYGTAKNILTVGAVDPIPSGYSKPEDAVLASFSSWGPTDDGRIKPDVVANGVDLLSSIAAGNNQYATYSGTSMATPNAAGSLLLLQEYYSQLHSGAFMRSATLKGIVIHTADEAGLNPGPDYKFGWGLINMVKAAAVITADKAASRTQRIQEEILTNGGTLSLPLVASGNGPLVATICWTDVKGVPETGNPLNSNVPKLINDLDIRIKKGATTYLPWKLNPASRGTAATKGDNILDNVEKIEIPDAVPGATYTIEITHKGTLARGSQAYSLIVSGVGGTAYCASGATNNAGARIDSVSFTTVRKANPAGCTTYTDYTNLTADIEPNSAPQLFVRLNSCDATTPTKIVKAFIDFNNNGNFTDPGELVATSAALSGNADFTATVTVPAGIVINNYTILRIVMQETSNPAAVTPCGAYAKGETQDYRVHILPPSNDLGIVEIVSPLNNECASGAQYVTVRVRNFGTVDRTNFPLTATVTGGATNATLNATFAGTVTKLGEVVYTFPTAFVAAAGTTYTITGKTTLSNDQVAGNDQKTATIAIAAAAPPPAGQAEICSNQVFFSPTPSGNDVFFWYDSETATVPIAAGNAIKSNVITADKKYYLAANNNDLGVGPVANTTLGGGNTANYSGYFLTFKTGKPIVIESAKLYIGSTNTARKLDITVGRNITFNAAGTGYSYTPVSSTSIDIYPTDPTNGGVFYLNLPVPSAGNYALIVSQDQNAALQATFFSNTGLTTNPYPMGIPDLFQVTGNLRSYLTQNDPEKYYFVFYDLKSGVAGCASSSPRTVVTASTATAPVITLNNNVFSSSSATDNQWFKNNALISGATSQTYTATEAGTYKVQVSDDFGCSLFSNEIPYAVTSVPNVDPAEIGLKTFPNPSNGKFFADFTVRTKADLSISIINALGQKVYETIYPGFTGRFNKTIEASTLMAGIYLLRIQHDNKSYLKKLFIK